MLYANTVLTLRLETGLKSTLRPCALPTCKLELVSFRFFQPRKGCGCLLLVSGLQPPLGTHSTVESVLSPVPSPVTCREGSCGTDSSGVGARKGCLLAHPAFQS